MINGQVINNGTNYGTQNGVTLGGYTALHLPAALQVNGQVINNGWNRGFQNGVFVRGF